MVAEVARTNNHAYVAELAADARFVAWLCAAGLTVEEAARIQPRYCATSAECFCILGYQAYAIYEGTTVAAPDGGSERYNYARVDVLHRAGDGSYGAIAVGDVAAESFPNDVLPLGTRVLATSQQLVATIEQGEMLGSRCLAGSNHTKVPLLAITKAHALEVASLDVAKCVAALEAEDPAWTAREYCEDGRIVDRSRRDAGAADAAVPMTSGADADDGGCSVTSSSSPESLAVLFAVIASLAARRLVLRRSAAR